MVHLFLFHRDLRLHDNTSLIAQLKRVKEGVIPIYIFTPEQIDPKKNKYFSNNSVQFMIESLFELSQEISKKGGRLYFFYGNVKTVLQEIESTVKLTSISFNIDYTPFARKRLHIMKMFCEKRKIEMYCKEDYALYDFIDGQTLKQTDKKPYLVYTPFFNFVTNTLKPRPIDTFQHFHFQTQKRFTLLSTFFDFEKKRKTLYTHNPYINVEGGRRNGLRILSNAALFKDYSACRDNLTYQTTYLSAYLHYTPISIREVYQKFGKNYGICRELIFRDFYMNIVYYFPHVLQGQVGGKNKSFRNDYDKIIWKFSKNTFQKWCQGQTGFPVVDAGMRQMNKTGYMHNRCRMIVSNFLVKDLHIDWRHGEKYFAKTLEDYDPINNSSGWQWSAGTGTDAQPYFRVFNPWTQQLDYDSQCKYIKKWIPELKEIAVDDIQRWFDPTVRKKYKNIHYPAPIVDHEKERKISTELYKKALR
jgi:deoxyribodipyrimidine photo-lyase